MRRKIEALLQNEAQMRLERAPLEAKAKSLEAEAERLRPLLEEVAQLKPLAAQVGPLQEEVAKLQREAGLSSQTWQRTEELFQETCAERYGEIETLRAQVGHIQASYEEAKKAAPSHLLHVALEFFLGNMTVSVVISVLNHEADKTYISTVMMAILIA